MSLCVSVQKKQRPLSVSDMTREFSIEEKWLLAVQQLQGAAKHLDGKLTQYTCVDSTGKETSKFVIEFDFAPFEVTKEQEEES